MSKVIATYLIHDEKDIEKKAEGIALGLTVGTWTDLPQLEREQLRKHKGEVVHIQVLEDSERTNRYFGKRLKRAIVQIAYPTANFSADIPALLTTVFGKLSLDGEVRLLDITFSNEWKKTVSWPPVWHRWDSPKSGCI